jgi:type I pantothenate kinase
VRREENCTVYAGQADDTRLSPFVRLSREKWGRLGAATPLSLSEDDVRDLRRISEHLSLEEATEVYLPLSWFLYLHVSATRNLYRATHAFLGKEVTEVPYVVGIAGSVAVGKSTVAQVLQALVSRWPGSPKVELVSTDGFLYPNRVLQSRGLMNRKGFPESYDLSLLLRFLADVKSGRAEVSAPVHSHLTYDILPDRAQVVRQPDVLIVEGLNMLEAGISEPAEGHRVFVSDFLDFSIYVDAEERHIKEWYLNRFLCLREEALGDSSAYFHRFASLSVEEAKEVAWRVWDEIDHPNLKENIEPTKDRARLILEKGPDHSIQSVRLRKL